MTKHYIIIEKIEMPTVTLYDLYLEVLADAMKTTPDEVKKILNH